MSDGVLVLFLSPCESILDTPLPSTVPSYLPLLPLLPTVLLYLTSVIGIQVVRRVHVWKNEDQRTDTTINRRHIHHRGKGEKAGMVEAKNGPKRKFCNNPLAHQNSQGLKFGSKMQKNVNQCQQHRRRFNKSSSNITINMFLS